MHICLFEDDASTLEPLTLTRPVFELRCGRTLLREKHVTHFGAGALATWLRRGVTELYHRGAVPPGPYGGPLTTDPAFWAEQPIVYVNARWLPPAGLAAPLQEPCVGLVGDEVAFVFLSHPPHGPFGEVAEHLRYWRRTLAQYAAGGALVKHPWDLVEHNAQQIIQEFEQTAPPAPPPPHVAVVGPRELLAIDATAKLDPLVVFDTTNGPVTVEAGAVVTAFSRIEGPCVIGAGAHVLGAKIRAGSTIGPQCRVGGEVEASILHGFSNKYHDGFLGHSYVGEWVNLGAGTHNSDLRNDYGEVSVPLGGVPTATRSSKVGCFIGDHTKTGLGTLLNTGTSIGAFCSVLPAGRYAPKWLPSFSAWWHGALREETDVRSLLRTAAVVMGRRGQTLTEAHAAFFQRLYEQTAAERRRALREAEQRQLRRSA
jgi:UDP-N-acetylglucosamine diphosphorylase/glucosamine-1-phosphate N-acetyltransferase